MTPKTRVAVIGCGVLGTRHAEIYHELPDVELAGVYDIHPDRTQHLADLLGVRAFGRLAQIFGTIDAASICTPAHTHFEVARELLLKGVHLLVEKPITTRLEDADELLRLAREENLTLQAGHVERFNPAVQAIKSIVKNPKFIECDRIGPYDSRITDVGVILDLMIHDIDILLHIVGSKVKSVDTIAMNIMSPTEDFANTRLTFENGTVSSLTASRIARDRLRKIRIFQENAYISLDYVRQEAVILTKENGTTAYKTIDIEKAHPLKKELAEFIQCVRTRERPLVSGEEGRAALEVALKILEQVRRRA